MASSPPSSLMKASKSLYKASRAGGWLRESLLLGSVDLCCAMTRVVHLTGKEKRGNERSGNKGGGGGKKRERERIKALK